MERGSERVRIIRPRDTNFDHYVTALVDEAGFGAERVYFGITSADRADQVRRRLRRAGAHLNPPVSVKAFWYACTGCRQGGPDCRYHVSFTAYEPGAARDYKLAQLAGQGTR
jgi:hypothetical protein